MEYIDIRPRQRLFCYGVSILTSVSTVILYHWMVGLP